MNAGQTLEHYTIIRPLGKGGMGEVYLAQDTKLKREVAIKVLPDSVRNDAERLKRFRREAEAAAKLNHPNIATIHSIEEDQGELFITMEYVDGKTLAEHIPSYGLDTDQFFEWFIPLSDALSHAHELGRVHRDLKPANIMIRQDGTPIILDFGLARIEQSESPELDSNAPTKTMKDAPPSLTQGKSFLGTPAYMSPEQIEGKVVDARTDLFSFGVVMYEAVTGQRPFKGDTVESMIARILEIDPTPATEVKPTSPYILWQVIRKCMVKDRERRMQTARELDHELSSVQTESQSGTAPVDAKTVDTRHIKFWQRPIGVSINVLAALIIGLSVSWFFNTETDAPLRKFHIPLEISTPLSSKSPAVSPDGKMVAYIDHDRLWIRSLDSVNPQAIPSSKGAQLPFWSPDGDYVAYLSNGKLLKVPAQGGTSIPICDLPNAELMGGGGSWGRDGKIVFGVIKEGLADGLFIVSDQGGAAKSYMPVDSSGGEYSTFLDPYFLPDNRGLLIKLQTTVRTVRSDSITSESIVVQTEDRREVIHTEAAVLGLPVYSPTGHILYQRRPADTADPDVPLTTRRSIWAIPFSIADLTRTGDPFLVVENGVRPTVSSDGTLVYRVDTGQKTQLVRTDRAGKVLDVIGEPNELTMTLALSPHKENRLAVTHSENNNPDIWIYDLDREIKSQLTFDPAYDIEPTWSPTGNRIAFTSNQNLYTITSDGNGDPELLTARGNSPNWSQDGSYVIYHVIDEKRDLWYLKLNDDQDPTPFYVTPFNEGFPRISPDGRYLAYVSDEFGQWEVYLKAFPNGKGKRKLSSEGGVMPRWNGRGDELFYVEKNTLMSVQLNPRSGEVLSEPNPLFSKEWARASGVEQQSRENYDVFSDGQSFVISQLIDVGSGSIVVVENWIKEFEVR
jgi:eukaryotic-like serine/threonine-protein kinase